MKFQPVFNSSPSANPTTQELHFMHIPTSISFFFGFTAWFWPFCFSDSIISEAGLFCGSSRPPPNVPYIPLFVRAMEVLSQRVTANGWGQYALISTNISVYTFAQCYQHLSNDDCLQCYAASRTRLPRCLPSVSGRIFLDGCFLRYDSYNFFNESVDPVWDTVNCNSSAGVASDVDSGFATNVGGLLDDVSGSAAANGRFAAAGKKGVYGLADCWNSTNLEDCMGCLIKANTEIRRCLPSKEGRALNTGCFLKYSTEKFLSNHTGESPRNSRFSRTGTTLAILLSVLAAAMLCLLSSYVVYRRCRKRKQERSNLGQIQYSYNKSNLNFRYETLEKATNYFSSSRKLGQGGSGSVYRGVLPNGKTVAVKRLFFSTRQWVDEFFNEVNIISGIHHKNLVKLLGCSIEGPESLLVYEYVPNNNLEHYLFGGKEKIKTLNWKERYEIVLGTAEGLTFLHTGSQNTIIHRDIKCSNILLDDNLQPKIADFGLARFLAPDKSHLTTGIAGTLGYMAPEYLVKGQLTEKADVYSFGILVLEIVCGRKNTTFMEESGSLLQTVWTCYKTERLNEMVDPCLGGDFLEIEAARVLKIGLLCGQASQSLRPSMEQVVRMMIDESCEIPEPNQPPFLKTGAASARSSSQQEVEVSWEISSSHSSSNWLQKQN